MQKNWTRENSCNCWGRWCMRMRTDWKAGWTPAIPALGRGPAHPSCTSPGLPSQILFPRHAFILFLAQLSCLCAKKSTNFLQAPPGFFLSPKWSFSSPSLDSSLIRTALLNHLVATRKERHGPKNSVEFHGSSLLLSQWVETSITLCPRQCFLGASLALCHI